MNTSILIPIKDRLELASVTIINYCKLLPNSEFILLDATYGNLGVENFMLFAREYLETYNCKCTVVSDSNVVDGGTLYAYYFLLKSYLSLSNSSRCLFSDADVFITAFCNPYSVEILTRESGLLILSNTDFASNEWHKAGWNKLKEHTPSSLSKDTSFIGMYKNPKVIPIDFEWGWCAAVIDRPLAQLFVDIAPIFISKGYKYLDDIIITRIAQLSGLGSAILLSDTVHHLGWNSGVTYNSEPLTPLTDKLKEQEKQVIFDDITDTITKFLEQRK